MKGVSRETSGLIANSYMRPEKDERVWLVPEPALLVAIREAGLDLQVERFTSLANAPRGKGSER